MIPTYQSATATPNTHACIKQLGWCKHQWQTSTGMYASTGALSHIVCRALWRIIWSHSGSISHHQTENNKQYTVNNIDKEYLKKLKSACPSASCLFSKNYKYACSVMVMSAYQQDSGTARLSFRNLTMSHDEITAKQKNVKSHHRFKQNNQQRTTAQPRT